MHALYRWYQPGWPRRGSSPRNHALPALGLGLMMCGPVFAQNASQQCQQSCGSGQNQCYNRCIAEYNNYDTYTRHVGQGVSLRALPSHVAEVLQNHFPDTDVRHWRFGHTSKLLGDTEALTDCNRTYFRSPSYVEELAQGRVPVKDRNSISTSHMLFALHELWHVNQCAKWGGRFAYQRLWAIELRQVSGKAPDYNFDSYAMYLAMPMEAEAFQKDSQVNTALLACCTLSNGQIVRPLQNLKPNAPHAVDIAPNSAGDATGYGWPIQAQVSGGGPPALEWTWKVARPGRDLVFISSYEDWAQLRPDGHLNFVDPPKPGDYRFQVIANHVGDNRKWESPVATVKVRFGCPRGQKEVRTSNFPICRACVATHAPTQAQNQCALNTEVYAQGYCIPNCGQPTGGQPHQQPRHQPPPRNPGQHQPAPRGGQVDPAQQQHNQRNTGQR